MGSLVAVVVIMTTLWGVALGGGDGGGGGDGVGGGDVQACKATLLTLSPCLDYIGGNSSTPTSVCCLKLQGIVQSKPQCLCLALRGGGSEIGVHIDKERAESLPDACHVKTPPVSECDKIPGFALTSPPGSDSNSTTSPKLPPSTGGTGAKSDSVSKSNGSMTKFPIHFTLFLLFISSSVLAIVSS